MRRYIRVHATVVVTAGEPMLLVWTWQEGKMEILALSELEPFLLDVE